MIIIDAIVCLILIIIGYNLKSLFPSLSEMDKKYVNYLYWFHILFAVVFHFYISSYGGDAQAYWGEPKVLPFYQISARAMGGSPSGVMFLLNYFPSNVLGLSFFTGNIIYAQFGFLGFLFMYLIAKEYLDDFSSIKEYKIFGVSIFPWIWFLPNLHFWSCGIGKDTILFFCISAFIYSLIKLKKRFLLFMFSLALATALRPHISLFLFVSFGTGYFFDGNLKFYQKALIIIVLMIGMVPLFNYVLAFVNLDSIETEVIEEFASSKSAALSTSKSGSSVDTSNYSLPYKVFTFLYRPLFFDINNAFAILASFENLILILFTIKVLRNKAIKSFKRANFLIKGSFLFFIIGSTASAFILGNLGIMLRQKNMFIPWFILFGFLVLHYKHINSKTKMS